MKTAGKRHLASGSLKTFLMNENHLPFKYSKFYKYINTIIYFELVLCESLTNISISRIFKMNGY